MIRKDEILCIGKDVLFGNPPAAGTARLVEKDAGRLGQHRLIPILVLTEEKYPVHTAEITRSGLSGVNMQPSAPRLERQGK